VDLFTYSVKGRNPENSRKGGNSLKKILLSTLAAVIFILSNVGVASASMIWFYQPRPPK